MELPLSNILLSWETKKAVTHLSYPRKYTSTHNDERKEIYLGIGAEYNKSLLDTEEVKNVESEVLGEWRKCKCGKNKIFLTLQVSTVKNPNAVIRDMIFRRELPTVLKAIGLAEAGLIALHPSLKKTPIYIIFKSTDPKYNKKEKWGLLGDY